MGAALVSSTVEMVADAAQGHAAPAGLRSIVGGFSINMSLLTELAPAYIERPIYNLLKSSAKSEGLKNPVLRPRRKTATLQEEREFFRSYSYS